MPQRSQSPRRRQASRRSWRASSCHAAALAWRAPHHLASEPFTRHPCSATQRLAATSSGRSAAQTTAGRVLKKSSGAKFDSTTSWLGLTRPSTQRRETRAGHPGNPYLAGRGQLGADAMNARAKRDMTQWEYRSIMQLFSAACWAVTGDLKRTGHRLAPVAPQEIKLPTHLVSAQRVVLPRPRQQRPRRNLAQQALHRANGTEAEAGLPNQAHKRLGTAQ